MFDNKFIKSTVERATKTFLQGYLAFWLVNPAAPVQYETLFTTNNLKAGVVALALSVATSVGSKGVGPDKEDPSLV